jgi:hypothetical protein
MRCCVIAAACAQFSVEFANSAHTVLQLCQYRPNIPRSPKAKQKWLHAGGHIYVRRSIVA